MGTFGNIFGGSNWLSGAGSAIDSIGKALGNPFQERSWSEMLQGLPSPVRVASTSEPTINYRPGSSYPAGTYDSLNSTTNNQQGNVLGLNTQGTSNNQQQVNQSQQPQGPNLQDQLRGEISGGWDSYISGLNGLLGGLGDQRASQEAIAQSQYDQGINTLTGQKTEGMADLDSQRERATENQTKTLRDLSGNLRNSFLAGNIYLGSRGAGDSSAADQYSYALNKVGTKARSDVMGQTAGIMSEIDDRAFKLQNIVDTESRNMLAEKDQKFSEVANWFAEAQNQVKQMMAQGQLGKSQDLAGLSRDILNRALGEVDRINEQARSKQAALESWAMSNASTIQGLKANMSQISQFNPNMPTAQAISGTPTVDSTGNLRVQTGYGGGQDEQRDIFGNRIA